MKELLIAVLVFILMLIPMGDRVIAQEDGHNPVPLKNFGGGRKGSKISPALQKLSDNYKSYVGRTSAIDPGFQSIDPFIPTTDGWVIIDAVAAGDTNLLEADLEKAGLQNGASFGRMVSGRLPIAALERLEKAASLNSVRPAYMNTRVGGATSQGDRSMRSDEARSRFGLDGTGVSVGTLSDSFNCLGGANGDVANGDLPGGILVLQELEDCSLGADEGRAMMQVIHDVAPGSSQLFHTSIGGQAGFAQGIIDLKDAGANVIVDDFIYFAEPMFQDGLIAQAVDTVVANDTSYFSSAGNGHRSGYESAFVPSGQFPVAPDLEAHDFGAGDIFQRFTLQPRSIVQFIFQWDQPIFDATTGSPGSASDMDLIILNEPPSVVIDSDCSDDNIDRDPVEICFVMNSEGVAVDFNLAIVNFSGPNPGLMKVIRIESRGAVSAIEHDTQSGTVYGHACADGAEAVGAAYYGDTPAFGQLPPMLEAFSSSGPCPILFNANGTRKPSPAVRQKPEIVAPDGTNNTFFGSPDPPCCEGDGFPNFFGTSASAPHAAAGAALIKQAFPAANGPGIYSALEATAIDMNGPGFDFGAGFGLVQVDLAVLNMDTVPPETNVDSAPPDPDNNPSPTIRFSGSDNVSLPNSINFECQLNDNGFSGCTSPVALGPLPDGLYTFNLRATDEAGNASNGVSHRWTIDTSGPGTTLEFDPTPKNMPPGGSRIVDIVVRDFADADGMSAYDISFTYDQSVVNVDGLNGGDFPFDVDPVCTILLGGGRVTCTSSHASSGATGDIRIFSVQLSGVGSAGSISPLTFTNIRLVDHTESGVPATGVDGRINLLSIQAEPSFSPFQDSVDGATGLKAGVTEVTSSVNGSSAAVLPESFQVQLSYDGNCIHFLDFRESDIPLTAKNIDDSGGSATLIGVGPGGRTVPVDLGLGLTRLVGSNQMPCEVDLEITALYDDGGNPIPVVPPDLSKVLLRGDARADGVINVADVVFIAQYLVGSRPACTTVVDVSCLHLVNAASVRHDGAFDQTTIADGLFISQYLAGLRDEFYILKP